LLAKDLATIDVISAGRLEVGIGAGWLPADHEPLGQEFPHAGERIDKLMEAVEVLRACWTQPTASYGGKHYQLSELANDPLPVQQPYPPLLIGGGGKRVLTYAARVANIVSLVPNMSAGKVGRESAANATGAATSEKLQWVREAAGDRLGDIELHTNLTNVFITNDRLPMMEKLARGYGLENQQDVFAIPHVVLGTVEQCAEQLLHRRVETGISHYTVFESGLADFGPILQLLAGK
jgi:probable F420-dependent oxidoreductase